jgi:hypothetical protein
MNASKVWHCVCCNEVIKPGEPMRIIKGDILKKDHPKKPRIVLKQRRDI